ncbi:hypothetical protein ADUPG1_003885, partial [Aduncisulcus paluster]
FKGDVACSIDLTDAFGSVDHSLLRTVIDDYTTVNFNSFLHGIINPLVMVDGTLRRIIQGCPQGSPLSPLLFNLCLDRAIPSSLKKDILAYADDIILFARDSTLCNESLRTLDESLRSFLFIINPSKCFAIASEELRIDETQIRLGTASETSYLGIGIETGSPLSASSISAYKNALFDMRRILALPLLPTHLFIATNVYIIPKTMQQGGHRDQKEGL